MEGCPVDKHTSDVSYTATVNLIRKTNISIFRFIDEVLKFTERKFYLPKSLEARVKVE